MRLTDVLQTVKVNTCFFSFMIDPSTNVVNHRLIIITRYRIILTLINLFILLYVYVNHNTISLYSYDVVRQTHCTLLCYIFNLCF